MAYQIFNSRCTSVRESGVPSSFLRVKAHYVRAIATSHPFMRNTLLQAVIDTATLKSNSIFASHYLRDLSFIYGDVYSLGPVILADSAVVGAPESLTR